MAGEPKKGYWIVHVNVTDLDVYTEYVRMDTEVFKKFDCKPLVRGGKHLGPEGEVKDRHVVLEFESFDKALECYNSNQYQEAAKLRLAASVSEITIVEGV